MSLEHIRQQYINYADSPEGRAERFDRVIASVRAEAWAEGYAAQGYTELDAPLDNPYRSN